MPTIADPPAPFTVPIVLCPACDHGIDPHGLDPGGRCHGRRSCQCLWSPNDIAGVLLGRLRGDLHRARGAS
jgi:hypothetical protein